MRKFILMLALLCSFFMFGCSTKSEDVIATTGEEVGITNEDLTSDENTTTKDKIREEVEESSELSSMKSDLNSYLELIDKPLEELESLFGQASLVFAMYGGDIHYYEKLGVGFGVDLDIISSILVYEGELDNGIKINMPLEEALKTLHLSQSDLGEDGEGGQLVFSEYHSYESYMRFFDDILTEILIKKG